MGLWTPEHKATLIPSVVVMVLIAIGLRFLLGKREHKLRMIPFQIFACILFLLEVGKQICSLMRGYDLYHLPFHFCSLFIFMLPVMAFYKGKHRQSVYAITAALCGSVFLLMLIYPNLIYSAWNVENFFKDYLSFHTVAFHNIVMLEFLLILALNLHEPQPKGEAKVVAWFAVGFCAVSASMSYLLKTNYASFYECNIPPLEVVRQNLCQVLGPVATQLLYVAIVAALTVAFVIMCYWLYRLLRQGTKKPERIA